MELSVNIGQLADALCKAQSGMKEVLKTKTAQVKSDKGSYSYKYAELADLLEAVKPALLGQGLAISQGVDSYERGVKVTTLLMHSSGEHLSSTLSMPVTGSTPQAYGSAITYARRYALSALLGVAPEDDDDAEAASSATPLSSSTLNRPRASEIHAALGKRGMARVDEHFKFATELLGREIRAFTDLSNEEADRLLAAVA
jgi:hypothetical protein